MSGAPDPLAPGVVKWVLGQAAEEVGCNAPSGLRVKLGKGELADTVYGHEHVKLALFCVHFCDIDVE